MGYDALAFKIGLAMGHISPARCLAKPEPVAYLYGTAEKPLPVLPQSNLRYAAIMNGALIGESSHNLWLSPVPFIQYANLVGPSVSKEVGTIILHRYTVNSSETAWTFKEEREFAYPSYLVFLTFWSNHDICKEDGTLYFAGSDPVPVYELEE